MIRPGDRIPHPAHPGVECIVVRTVPYAGGGQLVIARHVIHLVRPEEDRPRYVSLRYLDDGTTTATVAGRWSESDSFEAQMKSQDEHNERVHSGATVVSP